MSEAPLAWEGSYLKKYVDRNGVGDIPVSLAPHFESVLSFLRGLPASRAGFAYAEGKWSVRQVAGHVVDAQVIFAYRALCIGRGESISLPGFDENAYALHWRDEGISLEQIGDLYAAQAQAITLQTAVLRPEDWRRAGIANRIQVTPAVIFRALIGHERHHLNMLRERYGLG